MSKSLRLLFLFAVAYGTFLNAQTTTDQVTTGAGYTKFDYYKFSDGSDQLVNNDAWDIAFSNLGPQYAGIFVNESTASSMGQTLPGVEAYFPFTVDFNEVIYTLDLNDGNRLYNPEISWAGGAFNTVVDSFDPYDYGWGFFNPANNTIEGTWVFALKLRNGDYKKILFQTYDGTTYTFKAANLDGTGEQTYSVSKTSGNGSPVVYFSFANPSPVTPVDWDIVFCRYISPLLVGMDVIQYPVAGILHNDGALSAKATGVDPDSVSYQDYLDSLQTKLDVVGHDWKYFSGTAWSILPDRAYFVKALDNKLYKVVFTNFGGSINGTATFERTYLTELSGAADLPPGIEGVSVFPNPSPGEFQVAFTSAKGTKAVLTLYNASGQSIWQGKTPVQQGLNVLELNGLPALPTGMYVLSVRLPDGAFSRKVAVR